MSAEIIQIWVERNRQNRIAPASATIRGLINPRCHCEGCRQVFDAQGNYTGKDERVELLTSIAKMPNVFFLEV